MSEPLAVVLLGPESLAPGQGAAARLRPAVPGAAVLPPRPASAESAAAAGAGLWPAAAAEAAAVAAAGRSSVSAAVGSLLGTPQGTGQLLVAGLLRVLPETEQNKVTRNN